MIKAFQCVLCGRVSIPKLRFLLAGDNEVNFRRVLLTVDQVSVKSCRLGDKPNFRQISMTGNGQILSTFC